MLGPVHREEAWEQKLQHGGGSLGLGPVFLYLLRLGMRQRKHQPLHSKRILSFKRDFILED